MSVFIDITVTFAILLMTFEEVDYASSMNNI